MKPKINLWESFSIYFIAFEGFYPSKADSNHMKLYAYYVAGAWNERKVK